jgi:hypothetical protein
MCRAGAGYIHLQQPGATAAVYADVSQTSSSNLVQPCRRGPESRHGNLRADQYSAAEEIMGDRLWKGRGDHLNLSGRTRHDTYKVFLIISNTAHLHSSYSTRLATPTFGRQSTGPSPCPQCRARRARELPCEDCRHAWQHGALVRALRPRRDAVIHLKQSPIIIATAHMSTTPTVSDASTASDMAIVTPNLHLILQRTWHRSCTYSRLTLSADPASAQLLKHC